MNRPQPGYALASALQYAESGYRVIPIKENAKWPPMRWKKWQTEVPDEQQLYKWFACTRYGVALVCGQLIMVDVDDAEEIAYVLEHCVQRNSRNEPPICTTPSGGFHIHTKAREGVPLHNQVKIKGRAVDLRTQGGFAIVPPTPGYEWQTGNGMVPADDLPVFKATWTRDRKPTNRSEHSLPAVEMQDASARVRRAGAYLSHIEGAVSGQGGHNQAMRAAGVLIQKFGLTIDEAWLLFKLWNETCEPPFTDKELMHKLQSAERNKGKYHIQ